MTVTSSTLILFMMKNYRIILALIIGVSVQLHGQELKVKVDAYTDEGITEDITLTMEKIGEGVPNVLQYIGRHKLFFGPNETFYLTYSKEGYISKTIFLETPKKLYKNMTIEFDIVLQPQEEDFEVVYDAPVGHIFFQRSQLHYETDYTYTSIQDENIVIE